MATHETVLRINDPKLIAAARVFYRNRAAYKRYEAAKKTLAEGLRGQGMVRLGDEFLFSGYWEENTSYPVPEEIKILYKKVNPKARFKWKMERISSAKRKK